MAKISFGESIAPQSIQSVINDPKKMLELLDWHKGELENFKNAIDSEGYRDFTNHYKYKIRKKLDANGLYENYFEHMKMYARIEEIKLISVKERIDREYSIIKEEIERNKKKQELISLLREGWDPKARTTLAKKQSEKIREFFIETFKMRCKHLSTYNSFIYESFFVVECNCKFLAGMGCYRFAKNISESKIINHSDVWKTLKNLSGKQKEAICDHCFTKTSCNFKKRFIHLANLYAASIKLRMLSDYSEVFREEDIEPELYKIITEIVIPTTIEIHKFKVMIKNKSKIMWSPITEKDLGIY